jgi:putative transposase
VARDQDRFCKIFAHRRAAITRHDQPGRTRLWQRRYWEHTIRNDRDFAAHMDYTHFNPVKHGFVEHPVDWPHSSFHRCVASGLYPAEWRGGSDEPQQTGERL